MAMAVVDGIVRPGYAVKSAIKLALFMLIPLAASGLDRGILYLQLLRPNRRGLLPAIVLGVGIYGGILGVF